jgi:hypothetical protein
MSHKRRAAALNLDAPYPLQSLLKSSLQSQSSVFLLLALFRDNLTHGSLETVFLKVLFL